MQTGLRQRVPFTFKPEDDDNDNTVLDDEQQEEILKTLRAATAVMNEQSRLLVWVVVGLSALLQIVVLFKASPSPLLFLFPNPKAGHIPFSIPLTLLYIAIHANLLVLSDIPNGILQSSQALPLKFLYPVAAIAPSLSIYLRNPWQVSIWWCTTFTMVYLTQFILDTIEDQNYQVAQLEGLRYRAPGA
ncbi:hypothetical protein CC2G_013099 [Coprinopsis cinerea AmutBmut pab1-1]|nr:hypothetical protein CC2G_013099 [Coprinopsis cinerea AmutBmut pab1-1]